MKVLVACERSGVVREAFRKRGHDAFSCDLVPADDRSAAHYIADVMDIIGKGWDWDLMIAHPPCTALAVSGNRYYAGSVERDMGYDLVYKLLMADIPKICLENPVGVISTYYGKPAQIIQPYQFGDDASKKTCLWLKNLPPLPIKPELRVPGRLVLKKEIDLGNGEYDGLYVERWGNQTDSGQNRLGPSEDRAAIRSKTYQGIADAMAETWG
jgi:hypothetical protein